MSVLCSCLLYRDKVFTPVTLQSLIPKCFLFNVVCEDEGIVCAYFKRTLLMLMVPYEVQIWFSFTS